jgi:hypothetical protein
MQLIRSTWSRRPSATRRRTRSRLATLALALLAASAAASARADGPVEAGTTTTIYREAGGPLETTVITPSVDVGGTIRDRVRVAAGWEADVVSGASVAVVDAPSPEVDAVSSATRYDDLRNTGRVALGFLGEVTRLDVGYSFGQESDYRSNAFHVAGHAELFERNTLFDISYSRSFDRVCDLRQPNAQEAVDRQRLPTSDGCFGGPDRVLRDLSVQTFQGSWTQNWTPYFASQLTLTAGILHGFQSNPYRAVWLGRAAAQEHHPNDRTRYAAGLGLRIWLKPLHGALQPFVRLYRDTWGVASVTSELAYEQTLGAGVRLRARGRYYVQRGAIFYSDDYAFDPAGQYFTGDRELSPMSSFIAGGRVEWAVPPDEDGRIGFLQALRLVGKADYLRYRFDDYHYGLAPVPNRTAFLVTVGLEASF